MSQLLACAATLAVALASPLPVAAPASARSRVRTAMIDPGSEPRRSPRLRTRQHLLVAAADEPAGGAPSSSGPPAAPASSSQLTSWFIRNRSLLLLVALVVHKCTTDGLTRWTRLQTSYSGATVAVLSEVFKFPLIIAAVSTLGGGPSQIIPVFRGAIAKPLGNCWIALCYTFNNLLYYDALSTLSAVAYQARGFNPDLCSPPAPGPLTPLFRRRTPHHHPHRTCFVVGARCFVVGGRSIPHTTPAPKKTSTTTRHDSQFPARPNNKKKPSSPPRAGAVPIKDLIHSWPDVLASPPSRRCYPNPKPSSQLA